MKVLYFLLCMLFLCFLGGDTDVPDNSGKEFIIGFMDNIVIQSLNVFLTTNNPATVQVRISAHPNLLNLLPLQSRTANVSRGSVTKVDIPISFAMKTTYKQFNGLFLSSDDEFIVYGSNAMSLSLDAFLALPVESLGQEYITGSYKACLSFHPAFVGLIGIQNSTHVEITPPPDKSIILMGVTVSSKTHIVLDRLETIQIQSSSDITGTRINSTKPLSVMSGNMCSNIPCGVRACDHLVEQMYPVDRWGYTYIVVPSAYRQSGDIVRIVGSTDDTLVGITGISRLTLNRSEFFEFKVLKNAPVFLNASKPIMVLQFTQSHGTDNLDSDPYMMVVPAIEQFTSSYTIATANLPDKVYKNFVNVVIKNSSKEGLRVDGAAVNGVTWLAIPGTDFIAAQLSVTAGTHRIEHISPIQTFSVFSYGFAESVSYGYPGGLRLANLDVTKCLPNTGQPADGVDNDCDMKIDEELLNGIDDDDDGVIDEDLSSLPPDVDFPKDTVIVSGDASVTHTITTEAGTPNATGSERCIAYRDITINYTDTTNDNGCGVDIKRTWLVQDGCGNIVRSVQTILVYNSWQALRAHPGQNCTGMVEVVGCNDTADVVGQCTTTPCPGNESHIVHAGDFGCACDLFLDTVRCVQGENLTTTKMPERVRPSTEYLAVETTPESPVLTWSTGKTQQHTGSPTIETTTTSQRLWTSEEIKRSEPSTTQTTPKMTGVAWSSDNMNHGTEQLTSDTTAKVSWIFSSTEKVALSTKRPYAETVSETLQRIFTSEKTKLSTEKPSTEIMSKFSWFVWSTDEAVQRTTHSHLETTAVSAPGIWSTEANINEGAALRARKMDPKASEQRLTEILPPVAGVILLCGAVVATSWWLQKRMKRKIRTSPAGEAKEGPSSTQKDKNDSREEPQEDGSSEIPYVPPATGAIPNPPTTTQFPEAPSRSGSDGLLSKDTDSPHVDEFRKTVEPPDSVTWLHVMDIGGTVSHDLPPVSAPFNQYQPQLLPPPRLPPLRME